jgi:hypothetical protein
MPVVLAGQTYLACELRLSDLARLEAWAIASLGSPLDGLDDTATAQDYRDAWTATEAGPPKFGSPEVDASIFATIDGRSLYLAAVLRDDPASLSVPQLRELAGATTDAEWQGVDAIAFALHEADFLEVVRRADAFLGLPAFVADRRRGKSVSWSQAIVEAVTEYHLTFAEVGAMTLGQWRLLRSGGEAEAFAEPLPADPALEDRVTDARLAFWKGYRVWDVPATSPGEATTDGHESDSSIDSGPEST